MATAVLTSTADDKAMDVRALGDLQARLRAMSYSEPVTIESASLVRHLLADMVRASEAKEHVERSLEKAQREALDLSQTILPLRKENASLTRENNSLHLEIIHQEEAITEREKACALQLQSLQDDLKRLQFVSAQKTQQCARKEQEVTKLQVQLERFIAMGTDAPRPQRSLDAPSIERRGSGVFVASESSPRQSPRKSKRIADEQVLAALQVQTSELTAENEQLRAQLASYDAKLATREREIARLAKRSLDAVSADGDAAAATAARQLREQDAQFADAALLEAAELQREQLESQVDLLNSQVAKYEVRLKDAHEQLEHQTRLAEELKRASELNDKYAGELRALQTKYQSLEAERATSATAAAPPTAECADLQASRGSNDAADADPNALAEQIASLTAHRDRLEDALRATHYDKISYTNALANANAHSRGLATNLARAEAAVEELTARVRTQTQKLADARTHAEAQTRELDAVRAALTQSEDARRVEVEKNASLHRELRSIDTVLAQRDDECRALNHSLLQQKREVERLSDDLAALQHTVNEDDGDGGNDENDDRSARSRKALAAQERKWLDDERQELRRGKEELLTRVLNLEDALQTAQSALARSNAEKDALNRELDVQHALRANAERAVDDRKREVATLESALAASRETVRELERRERETQVLLQRADASEHAQVRVQSELLALQQRVETLRDDAATATAQREASDQLAQRQREELDRAQSDLAAARKATSTLEAQLRELTDSYDNAVAELRSARQRAQHYEREFEALAQAHQSQQVSRSSDQSALASSQTTLSELRSRVQQLEAARALQTSARAQLETRLEQEKLSHRSAQSELAVAQSELLATRESLRACETSVTTLRDELRAKDRELTDRTESVESFKLLVEQMEASRAQLLVKVTSQQTQLTRAAQDADALREQLAARTTDVQTRSAEVASLKTLTRTLDAERDALADQLDALTESHDAAMKQIESLRAGAETESAAVRDLERHVAQLVAALSDREAQIEQFETRGSALEAEVERLETLRGLHEAELAALAQDVENMTIENQALTEACARAQCANASTTESRAALERTVRQTQRERDALAIELDDVRETYRSLATEHARVESARAEVAELHDALAAANETLRQQCQALETERDSARAAAEALEADVATYREQTSVLAEKLEAHDRALADRAAAQDELQHALETQRQVATEISAQRFGAQAQSAAVAQRIVHVDAQLARAKADARALADQLAAEASQRRSLESLVASLREKVAANDALIAHLEEQRAAMAHEIQSQHQRRAVTTATRSGRAMDMSELSHASQSTRGDRRHRDGASSSSNAALDRSTSSARDESPRTATPPSERGLGNSATSSLSPMRSLEDAQRKCQELEDRLTQQDDTIKQLERSRSKFKRFAVKYEREIEQRDRLITELRSSNASSFVSPDARGSGNRSSRSVASSSSSSVSSSSSSTASAVRRARPGASAGPS